MNSRTEMQEIVGELIRESLPDAAVLRALNALEPPRGKTLVVAVGKAAWRMAKAAADALDGRYAEGFVITKYRHSEGEIPGMRIFEAGHPQMDENGVRATEEVLSAVQGLSADDRVLLLISGGGSALFEKPLVPLAELQNVNRQLLASGADIVEINTIRKRLSAVKGGRFAQACAPAAVVSIILSDVVGDRPDMIASGPACPDASTSAEALEIVRKYGLRLSERALGLLSAEPVRALDNAAVQVTGGVRQLCHSAVEACARRGYRPVLLTDCLGCEAREAGRFLGNIARTHANGGERLAFIAGGETVVHLRGSGRGGRNQELALALGGEIEGLHNVCAFSLGSDGTDGPTDAAGGMVDGGSWACLRAQGLSPQALLDNNDAYAALKACDGLIVTGATGTNVNDVSIVLIDR